MIIYAYFCISTYARFKSLNLSISNQLRTQEEAFFNSSTICSLLFLAYLKFKTRNMASRARISMLIWYPMITHIPFKSIWQSTGKAILMPQAAHFSITFLSKRKMVSLSSGFSCKVMHGKHWKKKHQAMALTWNSKEIRIWNRHKWIAAHRYFLSHASGRLYEGAQSAWTCGWLMTLIPNLQTGQIRTPWSSQSATSIAIRDLQASKTNDVGLFDRSVGFRVLFRYAQILLRTSEDIAVVAGLFLYIVPHPTTLWCRGKVQMAVQMLLKQLSGLRWMADPAPLTRSGRGTGLRSCFPCVC